MRIKMKKDKVFVGAFDTYHPEDYSFIGTWEECLKYIKKWGYEKMSYIYSVEEVEKWYKK